MKRELDIVILSDTHLGTYSCHAKELLNYLKSIRPKTLILNGDFVDMSQFPKRYFPETHVKVIHEILKMSLSDTKVYYITGNHDDRMRNFSEFSAGNFHLRDKLVLSLKNEKYWIFHGDVFDASLKHTKWLAKMGAKGYGWLILLNRLINKFRKGLGKPRMSFAGKIKTSIGKAVTYINEFENTAADLASENGYQYVITGHTHSPTIKHFDKKNKSVVYMNAGDWIENLTALEYRNNKWEIYKYDDIDFEFVNRRLKVKEPISKKTKEALLLNILPPQEKRIY